MNYEKNVIDISDLDKPIYRIFSKSRFIDLLKTKKNGLVRPNKWDDPFENFFLRSKAQWAAARTKSLTKRSTTTGEIGLA